MMMESCEEQETQRTSSANMDEECGRKLEIMPDTI